MSTYRMVHGDDTQIVRETYRDVEIDREDGWTVIFGETDAILRVRDEHIQSLEILDNSAAGAGDAAWKTIQPTSQSRPWTPMNDAMNATMAEAAA